MKCKKCGAELNDTIKNCVNCGWKNQNYTHFYIGNTPIKVSKSSFVFAIVLGVIVWFVIIGLIISNGSDNSINKTTSNITSSDNENQGKETKTKNTHITYENAFNYIKKCEDNIIESNKNSYNKIKESAAETIIFSQEYAELYCSFWSVLEKLEGEKDSRFGKSKLRWQIDYTKNEYETLLKKAFENGEKSFYDEYARIYKEEVFPIVNYNWENNIY